MNNIHHVNKNLKLGLIFDKILHGGIIVSGTLVWLMVVFVCAEVIIRKFTTNSLGWVIDTSGWSILFICFLSAAGLLKNEGHVKMDIVLLRLNRKKQALLNYVMSLIGAIVCFVITWYSIEATSNLFQQRARFVSSLQPLEGFITVIVPIGFFLLFIQFIRRANGYLMQIRSSKMSEQDVEDGNS